jgi:PBP superfamily domain
LCTAILRIHRLAARRQADERCTCTIAPSVPSRFEVVSDPNPHPRMPGALQVILDSRDCHFTLARVASVRDAGELTHAAVAPFVTTGMADVGLGIDAAARQFKLDFIPIARERDTLTCKTLMLAQPAVADLVALLKGLEFAQRMATVDG